MPLLNTVSNGQLSDASMWNQYKALAQGGQVYDVINGYGATGNGSTDDTTAIQDAINAAVSAGGGTIYFPEGTYIANGLTLGSNITLSGAGWSSILKQPTGAADNTYLVSVNSGSGGSADPTTNITGILIQNLALRGRSDADVFTQYVHLLNLNACSNTIITGCLFQGFRGDAIYIGSSNNPSTERHNERIQIYGNQFDGLNNNNRNAISVIDGTDILIENNTFINCTASNMPGAIDLEPNAGTFSRVRNIMILGNTFRGVGGNAGVVGVFINGTQASLTTPMQNVTIGYNLFQNNTAAIAGDISYLQAQQPATTDVPNNAVVVGNTFQNGQIPFAIAGVRGLTFSENSWDNYVNAASIGYTYNCVDVTFARNHFSRCGATDGRVINLIRVQRMWIEENYFFSCVADIFRFNIDSAGASSDIWAIGNKTRNCGTNWSSRNVSHTTTAATNLTRDNDLTGLSTQSISIDWQPRVIVATSTWSPGAIINNAAATTTITANGAALGDFVLVNHSTIEGLGTRWLMYGYVSAANTVTVVLYNATGGSVTPASGTLRVKVFKQDATLI